MTLVRAIQVLLLIGFISLATFAFGAQKGEIFWQDNFPIRVGEQIMLSWIPISDIKLYIVIRTDLQTGDKVKTEVQWPQHIDLNVDPKKSYTYQIRAFRPGLKGVFISEVREISPTIPPPPKLDTTFSKGNKVYLVWENVPKAFYYNVYRSKGDEPYKLIGSAYKSEYLDFETDPTQRYRYVVRSVSSYGEESYDSDPATITPRLRPTYVATPKSLSRHEIELDKVIPKKGVRLLKEPVDIVRFKEGFLISNSGEKEILAISTEGKVLNTINGSTANYSGRWGIPWGLSISWSGEMIAATFLKSGKVRIFTLDGELLKEIEVGKPAKASPEMPSPQPMDVVLKSDGSVWVSDSTYGQLIRYDVEGMELFRVGEPRHFPREGGFIGPSYLAYNEQNQELYLVDSLSATVYVIDENGDIVRKWRNFQAKDGALNLPKGISITNNGELLIIDGMLSTVQRFTREGDLVGVYHKAESKAAGVRNIVAGLEGDDGEIYLLSKLNNVLCKLTVVASR